MRERRRMRMPGYDYSKAGAYFVTMNIRGWFPFFGECVDGRMVLSPYGKIVQEQWAWLFEQYSYLQMDAFVVMPDHFHGILWITGNGAEGCKIKTVPQLIGAFKTTSSKRIHLAGLNGFAWHRSYYFRTLFRCGSLNGIRRYILNNPVNWRKKRRGAVL